MNVCFFRLRYSENADCSWHQQIKMPYSAKGTSYMSKKIYVGNLNYATTEDTLKNSFAAFGEVTSAVIIKDRFTDQSKGFGFIEMADEGAADKAIADMNGKEIDGRRVRVNVAEERPPRRPRFDNGAERQ